MTRKTKSYIRIQQNNQYFQNLLKALTQEFDRVIKNIQYAEIRDDPSVFENECVTYPDVCEEYGQLDVMDYHPEIIELLKKLLPQSESPINIHFQLDYAVYVVSIKDIYNKIFEETFPYYRYWNSEFPKRLLKLINEWHSDFNKKRLPIEILVPLKGFYLLDNKNKK